MNTKHLLIISVIGLVLSMIAIYVIFPCSPIAALFFAGVDGACLLCIIGVLLDMAIRRHW